MMHCGKGKDANFALFLPTMHQFCALVLPTIHHFGDKRYGVFTLMKLTFIHGSGNPPSLASQSGSILRNSCLPPMKILLPTLETIRYFWGFGELESSGGGVTSVTALFKKQSLKKWINNLKGILCDFFILKLEQMIVLNKYYAYNKPIPQNIACQNTPELV